MATRARILADYVSGGATAAEFDYLDGVTSSIQTQLDAKSPTTGHASIATLGTVTSGTISTGTVMDDPTMTQGSDATGDVYYRAAGGALTRLATGADGTVLTSTGVGAVPAFEAVGSVAGTNMFQAYGTGTWANYASGDVIPFEAEKYDPDGVYTIASYRFTAPATGVYLFGYHVYVAQTDVSNSLTFRVDGSSQQHGDSADSINLSSHQATADDHLQVASYALVLTASQYVTVNAGIDSTDVYMPHSHWWGFRLK